MKITYLHHSGFLIECLHTILIFDYVKGDLPCFSKHKKIYVFVSHRHADHYDSHIYSLRDEYDVTYILSDDIVVAPQPDQHMIKADDTWSDAWVQVKTLTSTDEGVAFIVNVEVESIYFAGDLNWWDWGREDSVAEANDMAMRYLKEMDKITGMHFTVAFVPVDPRLNQRSHKGVQTFLQHATTKHLFMMHFFNDYAIQSQCLTALSLDNDAIVHVIEAQGQTFNL